MNKESTQTTNEEWIDSATEDHSPDLYKYDALAPLIKGLEGVTEEHIDFFRQEGYLAIDGVLSDEQVREAKDAISDFVEGKIKGFRGVMFEAKAREKLSSLSPEEKLDAVRKLHHFVQFDSRMEGIAANTLLLSLISRLIGDTPRLFQDMALIKPPRMGREKPWHQDNAYFNVSPDTRVVGVWIALDPATVENGCMRLMPGKHRDGPQIHFKRRDWQICDTQVMGKRCVAAPLAPGGVLFFDGLLPHGTPTNHSDQRRRALQFHYCAASVVADAERKRLEAFGSEGKDVEC